MATWTIWAKRPGRVSTRIADLKRPCAVKHDLLTAIPDVNQRLLEAMIAEIGEIGVGQFRKVTNPERRTRLTSAISRQSAGPGESPPRPRQIDQSVSIRLHGSVFRCVPAPPTRRW